MGASSEDPNNKDSEFEDQIVYDILDKLNGDFSMDYLIDNMFKTIPNEKIQFVLSCVKKALMEKNECVKNYLNTNQNQLLSCTDLIDDLKSYSDKSIQNATKLTELIHKIEALVLSGTTPSADTCLPDTSTKNLRLVIQINTNLFFREFLWQVKETMFNKGYYYLSLLLLKSLKDHDMVDFTGNASFKY